MLREAISEELIDINKLKSFGKRIYKIYVGIGILSIALLAGCVIFSVFMRYCFKISYAFLEEFVTTLFAFSTFWGAGICIIEDEHVIIDSLYNKFPAKMKRVVTFINYIIVLIVNCVMFKFGLDYALRYGNQISMGMRVPMIWMYGIIPLGSAIAIICIIIKLITVVKAPLEFFEYKYLE